MTQKNKFKTKKRKKVKKPKTYEGYFSLVEDEFFSHEIKLFWEKWVDLMRLLQEVEPTFWKNINGTTSCGSQVRNALKYSRQILTELIKDTIDLEKKRHSKKRLFKSQIE